MRDGLRQKEELRADGIWNAGPLEAELPVRADKIVGASDAFLVIDDTGLQKKGDHSVGVSR